MVLAIPRDSTSSMPVSEVFIAVDETDSVLYLTDDSQAWFWTESWQQGERRVDDYIERGEFEEFDSMDEFLRSLGLNE